MFPGQKVLGKVLSELAHPQKVPACMKRDIPVVMSRGLYRTTSTVE